MADNTLGPRLHSVARRIRADFEASRQTQHHGSRGTEREEIFQRFLDLYVPRRIDVVHNAEIISAAGDASPQCDIALVDEDTPTLQDLRSHRIIPAECAYGIVEVKSFLDGRDVRDACEKIRQTKLLARNSYARNPQYWIKIGNQAYEIAPLFGWVFAYDGIGLSNIGRRIIEWCQENPKEGHPDGIWVLDKGMFIWTDTEAGRPLARAIESDSRTLHLLTPKVPEDLLFYLVVMLSKLVSNVRLPPLLLGDYVHGDQGALIQESWTLG